MRLSITVRHAAIDGALRAHTRELVGKVTKVIRRPQGAQVVFTDEHGQAGVEIELRAPRGRVLIAKAQAADHRTALDAAIAKLKRQLLDQKETRRTRRVRRSDMPGVR